MKGMVLMILTKRDLEVVRFVLNMKFATIDDIHRKFFRNKQDGTVSESLWYARERLRDLVAEGFLSTERYRFENKCYYVGTKYGYKAVLGLMITDDMTAKPIHRIDVRTFDHDRKVMQVRLFLEEHEKVTKWQSDRQLKMLYTDHYSLRGNRDSAPDGLYYDAEGRLIAFEYEIAQKSKKRYY